MPLGLFRRRFGKIFIVIIFTFGLGFGFFAFSMKLFSITVIEIMGNNILVTVDQKRISKNLLFFPSGTIRQQVLSDNPWLSDVTFLKKFPHTLRIVPKLRTPSAILISQGKHVLIGKDAMVLTDGDMGLGLPSITIDLPHFRVGEILTDTRVIGALEFMGAVSDLTQIRSMMEYENAYFLVKSDKVNIYITHQKPIADSIASLQTLLSGFRIKGTLPTVVDLRFDKPVIKF